MALRNGPVFPVSGLAWRIDLKLPADAVLLDPLTFPEPDRIVSIRGTAPGSDLPDEFGIGGEFLVEYRENARTLDVAGVGVAVGLVGAFYLARVLESFLFEVSPIDLLTFAVTAAGMIGVALLASWVPARRASGVDPVEALAAE